MSVGPTRFSIWRLVGAPASCSSWFEDELLEDGHVGAAVLLRPGGGNPAALTKRFEPRSCAGFIDGAHEALEIGAIAGAPVFGHEAADDIAPGGEFGRIGELHACSARRWPRSGCYRRWA